MFVAYLVQNFLIQDLNLILWLLNIIYTSEIYKEVCSFQWIIGNSWSRDPMWPLLRINALITVILAVYKNNAEIIKDYIKSLALHRMVINLCNLMLLTFDMSNLFKPLQMSRFHALKYQRSGCKDIKMYKL